MTMLDVLSQIYVHEGVHIRELSRRLKLSIPAIKNHVDKMLKEGIITKKYEGRIEFEDRIVDNMCMQLVQKPELYDVLVLPNLYGDIISDLCAGLIGGLGIAPGANIGNDIALFEPVHGSAPKYKGMNKVNPTAMILSGVLMLEYLGEKAAAKKLERVVSEVISEKKVVTYDLGGTAKTSEMADEIIKKLGD